MTPTGLDFILITVIAALTVALIVGALRYSAKSKTRIDGEREHRINASVFNSVLNDETKTRIGELPSVQAKHEALLAEYRRLLPANSESQAQEAVKAYISRHGSEVNVQRADLRREQGSSGYTDDAGAFVPLYVGGGMAFPLDGNSFFGDGVADGGGGDSGGGGGDGGGGGGGGGD